MSINSTQEAQDINETKPKGHKMNTMRAGQTEGHETAPSEVTTLAARPAQSPSWVLMVCIVVGVLTLVGGGKFLVDRVNTSERPYYEQQATVQWVRPSGECMQVSADVPEGSSVDDTVRAAAAAGVEPEPVECRLPPA